VLTIAISTLNSDPKMDVYNIRSIASTQVKAGGQDANATATLKFVPAPTGGGGVTPPTPKAGDASFTNYPKNNNPFDTKDAAGEVSIGADWSSDTSKSPDTFLFQDANPQTNRVDFTDPNNATTPATAKWTNVTFVTQNVTFDPIWRSLTTMARPTRRGWVAPFQPGWTTRRSAAARTMPPRSRFRIPPTRTPSTTARRTSRTLDVAAVTMAG